MYKNNYSLQLGFIPQTQGWLDIWTSNNVIGHVNRLKEENGLTLVIDIKDIAFDNLQHSVMPKTLSKLGRVGNFSKLMKNIYINLQLTY